MKRLIGAVTLVGAVSVMAHRALAQPAAGSGFTGAQSPVTVGPVPEGLTGVSPGVCAPCHPEIADEWSRSQHATAWTDPVFELALAREPRADCQNCHGPRSEARNEGVSCAVCHVRGGHVHGVSAQPFAHRTVAAPRMAASVACSGCHQFNFPAPQGWAGGSLPSQPMQDTLREWREGGEVATCQGCHMPRATDVLGRSHASHRFAGWSDPELLRGAVQVTSNAAQSGDQFVVTIELTAMRGHAVPTGDQFRALELSGWLALEPGSRHRVTLRRTFHRVTVSDPQGGTAVVRREESDTRLRPGERRTFTFRWPRARGPARWSLQYVRIPDDQPLPPGMRATSRRTLMAAGEASVANR